jgi:transcriptional antiterminator NusG
MNMQEQAPNPPVVAEEPARVAMEESMPESMAQTPAEAVPASPEQTPVEASPASPEQTPVEAVPASAEQTPAEAVPASPEQTPVEASPEAPEQAPTEAAPAQGVPQAQAPATKVADGRAWYVVHSYSGFENKVKVNLEHRIASMNMRHRIFQVTVPTEEEIEIREGHRRKTKRLVFPGYILVQMIMDDDSWYVVRNTPGVTGFVSSGTGNKPSPLRPEEAEKIFARMSMEAPKIKVGFREGQTVRIVDGPFADFVGTVEEMNLDKGKVRVMVSFFGRETPVELDFLQVQKQ